MCILKFVRNCACRQRWLEEKMHRRLAEASDSHCVQVLLLDVVPRAGGQACDVDTNRLAISCWGIGHVRAGQPVVTPEYHWSFTMIVMATLSIRKLIW